MIVPSLLDREPHVREQMDDPGCDEDALRRTYAQFRVVNAVVAGWRSTYRRHVRPVLRADRVTLSGPEIDLTGDDSQDTEAFAPTPARGISIAEIELNQGTRVAMQLSPASRAARSQGTHSSSS